MKTYMIVFWVILFTHFAQAQNKEVLLVGTMHTVPKIVKRSYKPLLKKVLKYNPEAIFVESPRAEDSISWEYLKDGWSKSYKKFYFLADSLQQHYQFNREDLDFLLKKDFSKLSDQDLETIVNSFGYLRDYANYDFYKYIQKYGAEGSPKPTRNEDGDLTAKLALQLNIKHLNSMDDQQTYKEYREAWLNCAKEGSKNGDNAINQKLNKKNYNSAILPAIFRGLAKHINKRKSLERLDKLAAFTYVQNKTENCELGTEYWNQRNERMAQNIGSQIITNPAKKSVVIVGAAHIIRLEKELKENFPGIKVKLINE
jgi:hypothetical protein